MSSNSSCASLSIEEGWNSEKAADGLKKFVDQVDLSGLQTRIQDLYREVGTREWIESPCLKSMKYYDDIVARLRGRVFSRYRTHTRHPCVFKDTARLRRFSHRAGPPLVIPCPSLRSSRAIVLPPLPTHRFVLFEGVTTPFAVLSRVLRRNSEGFSLCSAKHVNSRCARRGT